MRYHYFTNSNNKVVVTSTYAGKVVRGVAKCNANDTFDYEKGARLAQARCDEKVAKKRHRQALNRYAEAIRSYEYARENLLKMREYAADAERQMRDAESNVDVILSEM